MSAYHDALQRFWTAYEQEHGKGAVVDAQEVASWAIKHGYWKPRPQDIVDQLAEDLKRAWREEYRVDALGRRYRAKHAVRITRDGKQASLWADMDTAPRQHMERAFAQRRQQIVGDCLQLKIDVDVYNDRDSSVAPIPLVLDFTDDVDEAQRVQTRSLRAA